MVADACRRRTCGGAHEQASRPGTAVQRHRSRARSRARAARACAARSRRSDLTDGDPARERSSVVSHSPRRDGPCPDSTRAAAACPVRATAQPCRRPGAARRRAHRSHAAAPATPESPDTASPRDTRRPHARGCRAGWSCDADSVRRRDRRGDGRIRLSSAAALVRERLERALCLDLGSDRAAIPQDWSLAFAHPSLAQGFIRDANSPHDPRWPVRAAISGPVKIPRDAAPGSHDSLGEYEAVHHVERPHRSRSRPRDFVDLDGREGSSASPPPGCAR